MKRDVVLLLTMAGVLLSQREKQEVGPWWQRVAQGGQAAVSASSSPHEEATDHAFFMLFLFICFFVRNT